MNPYASPPAPTEPTEPTEPKPKPVIVISTGDLAKVFSIISSVTVIAVLLFSHFESQYRRKEMEREADEILRQFVESVEAEMSREALESIQ